jgi:FlaG/FlaF family flagellin (archaellin)
MKGISDVIAMLLMLVITIGLVGVSYSYITGVFTARTAVVLSIDAGASSCTSSQIVVAVRNDGTSASGPVQITISKPDNQPACTTITPNPIPSINPGVYQTATCTRSGTGSGYYKVFATTDGSSAQGIIYCAS